MHPQLEQILADYRHTRAIAFDYAILADSYRPSVRSHRTRRDLTASQAKREIAILAIRQLEDYAHSEATISIIDWMLENNNPPPRAAEDLRNRRDALDHDRKNGRKGDHLKAETLRLAHRQTTPAPASAELRDAFELWVESTWNQHVAEPRDLHGLVSARASLWRAQSRASLTEMDVASIRDASAFRGFGHGVFPKEPEKSLERDRRVRSAAEAFEWWSVVEAERAESLRPATRAGALRERAGNALRGAAETVRSWFRPTSAARYLGGKELADDARRTFLAEDARSEASTPSPAAQLHGDIPLARITHQALASWALMGLTTDDGRILREYAVQQAAPFLLDESATRATDELLWNGNLRSSRNATEAAASRLDVDYARERLLFEPQSVAHQERARQLLAVCDDVAPNLSPKTVVDWEHAVNEHASEHRPAAAEGRGWDPYDHVFDTLLMLWNSVDQAERDRYTTAMQSALPAAAEASRITPPPQRASGAPRTCVKRTPRLHAMASHECAARQVGDEERSFTRWDGIRKICPHSPYCRM